MQQVRVQARRFLSQEESQPNERPKQRNLTVSCPTAISASHVKHRFNTGKQGGGGGKKGISKPQVFSLLPSGWWQSRRWGLGGGTGLRSLGLRGERGCIFYKKGFFLISSPPFLFFFGLERKSCGDQGGAGGQRCQKATADPKNPTNCEPAFYSKETL